MREVKLNNKVMKTNREVNRLMEIPVKFLEALKEEELILVKGGINDKQPIENNTGIGCNC